MRIAIFDGILETHVGDSFERAFISRGHQVLNTGKVGRGFQFPGAQDDVSHLQHAISQVLAHDPDWVIVMRPASLPPRLLNRLRSKGTKLAVWLSDDPVLFHLSYAPLLESYDLVLHCGTADVLQYYEDFFGRPTGVNFPFWTDHEAFPCVWGSETPESTALFLGNVHDHVRRRRYFSLGEMAVDVRVHGSVGTDYLGLSGGYLDSDAEVVNAGARAQVAINIPQFFRDHRGLPTWFPGLDELGYFEFPSRVVQYIAMGLPVVSVIPGQQRFQSLPEMMVVGDIAEADRVVSELVGGDLKTLSQASERRFSMNFSAYARVLAFESLTTDDSWRALDARERNLWFTQFDGRLAPAPPPSAAPPRVEVSEAVKMGQVLVLGADAERPTSRVAVTARALSRLGADVVVSDVNDLPGLEQSAAEVTGLVVCGRHEAAAVAESLPASSWRVVIDDTSRSAQELGELLASFDAVGVRDAQLHAMLSAAGHTRVEFCPPGVDADFVDLVDGLDGVSPLVRTTSSLDMDALFAPALNSDVIGSMENAHSYEDLSKLPLDELARLSRTRIGLVGFSGTPTDPVINDVTPFVAAAADVVIVPRVAPETMISPYPSVALQVRERGELAMKLRRLADSSSLRNMYASAASRGALSAEASMERLIAAARRGLAARGAPGYSPGLSTTHMVCAPIPVPPVEGGEAQRTVNLTFTVRNGDHASHIVELLEGDVVIHSEGAAAVMQFLVLAQRGRALAPLAVRLRFIGDTSLAPAESLVSVGISGSRLTDTVTAQGARPAGTVVWRRM